MIRLRVVMTVLADIILTGVWFATGGCGSLPNPCVPATCAAQGATCGSIPDGCGGTLDCGNCAAPDTCGGGETSNLCGCTPTTCADQGAICGSIPDGCGDTLDCGTCSSTGQPLDPCGNGLPSCSDDSYCAQGCTPDNTMVAGVCNPVGREFCEGFAGFQCFTPGTECLSANLSWPSGACSDYAGLCLTAEERDVVCSGPHAAYFACAR